MTEYYKHLIQLLQYNRSISLWIFMYFIIQNTKWIKIKCKIWFNYYTTTQTRCFYYRFIFYNKYHVDNDNHWASVQLLQLLKQNVCMFRFISMWTKNWILWFRIDYSDILITFILSSQFLMFFSICVTDELLL